jgi:two-component system sensor histidine kinase BaeS
VKSLRTRLLVAIAAAVLLSVGLSLLTGALLVRRSVERDAAKALARQADVLAAQVAAAPPHERSNLGTFLATQQERLAILSRDQAALLLPTEGSRALRSGRAADGKVTVRGTRFFYSARPTGPRALVLLRPTKLAAADWRPFGVGFLFAALVGAALAAIGAFVLARAIAGPIRRVAEASRSLAAGEQPATLPVSGSQELSSLAAAFNHMSSELARARAAERQFLLSVSHELKTPLTAISVQAEALEEGLMPPVEAGGVIRREAMRLERLVRDLLDLARLNQRSFAVDLQPIDLVHVVQEIETRYDAQADALGLALETRAPEAAPAEGDPDRLLQVVSNLVENALRSTPTGGRVTVTAAPGRLTVEDTGPGIATEDLPHAFERFFLYNRYAANRAVGTGLGLAIVKELTQALRGEIAVESGPGGTRFVVTLPTAVAEEATAVLERRGLP